MTVGLAILVGWIAWTCKDDIAGNDPAAIVFPDSAVSYHGQVEPLFLRACALPECHDVETRAAGLSFETYGDAMFSQAGVIIPQDTAHSLLIGTVEGRTPPRMPPQPLQPLNANQIKGLKRWIMEGAKNN